MGLQKVVLKPVWVELASKSESEYVKNAAEIWDLWTDLPESHRWLHDSAESLNRRLATEEPDAAAKFYTIAIMEDFHAYAYMQACKVHDLLNGVVRSLNDDDLLVAAVAARAALEATAALMVATVRANESIRRGKGRVAESVQSLADFNDQIARGIWGGKSPDRPLESVNFMTLMKVVLKGSADTETSEVLERTYSALCEVAHPSATGHQIYWQQPIGEDVNGPWLIEVTHGRPNTVALAVAHDTLWVLGWAAYRSALSFREAARLVGALAED